MVTDRGRSIWLLVRVSLLTLSFLGEALRAKAVAPPVREVLGALVQAGAVTVVTTVMWVILIGIQAMNPRSARSWEYPKWTENFLDVSRPLRVAHFLAWYFSAIAAGAGLSWVARGVENSWLVSTGAGAAAGTWLAVNIAWHTFRWKRPIASSRSEGVVEQGVEADEA